MLDTLSDRLMFRLAYRQFNDHEALVVNHAVQAGNTSGVRWYELRDPGGAPKIIQQGTYAPDSTFRWMGSIAMDKAGNMLMGTAFPVARSLRESALPAAASAIRPIKWRLRNKRCQVKDRSKTRSDGVTMQAWASIQPTIARSGFRHNTCPKPENLTGARRSCRSNFRAVNKRALAQRIPLSKITWTCAKPFEGTMTVCSEARG